MHTTGISADDVLRPGSRWRDCEIWDGLPMVREPSGGESDMVGLRVMGPLHAFVQARRLGWTFMSSQGFLLAKAPDRLLAADGAYVSKERLAAVPRDGFVELAPDFLIEVRSPKDTWEAVIEKCGIWLAHGVSCAWAIDPLTQTVAVLRAGRDPVIHRRSGRASAAPALAEFVLDVEDLFADLA